MAKALMIQGTGSGVGKSLIVAGLCRFFRDRGVNVAPFKAQNMALNSFITREGGEIGRAQAFQSAAARLEPSIDMNPILLKATGEAGCQVIVNGRVHANMQAKEYYAFKQIAWAAVTEAYERLSRKHDLVILEGAGSPAEINLSRDEVVNMSIARHAGASVLLVGDIDKGGVFASLYGTLALLDGDADRIKAFIINKFRGDLDILRPGLDMISKMTGRPVLGVVPYRGDLGLHEEDGIPPERLWWSVRMKHTGRRIKVVVLRLRYISNFTDFDPFLYEPDVDLVYSLRDEDIEHADLVIIPGSKNTVQDLLVLREAGIDRSLDRAVQNGVPLIGICGGYQMLGKKILDPHGLESVHRETAGLGLLDVETVLEPVKVTAQVEAKVLRCPFPAPAASAPAPLAGYEIHMGRTTGAVGLFQVTRTSAAAAPGPDEHRAPDGSMRGNVWGTYIHGIFDNDEFRRNLINSLRAKKGLPALDAVVEYAREQDEALERWTAVLKESIDMQAIERMIA